MSHFEGLSNDVLGILLVGAEGCSETDCESWIRDASEYESQQFKEHCQQLFKSVNGPKKPFDFRKFIVDGNGRPYWIKAVLDKPNTPLAARYKARQLMRVLRLDD